MKSGTRQSSMGIMCSMGNYGHYGHYGHSYQEKMYIIYCHSSSSTCLQYSSVV